MYKLSLWSSSLTALVGSLLANALVDFVFFPFTGVPADVMTFKILGPVGVFTVAGVAGAVVVFALLRRFAKKPNRIFVWTAVVVLFVSFLPDLLIRNLGPMFSEITQGGVVLLMAMHVACALVTVVILTKLTKPQMKSQE